MLAFIIILLLVILFGWVIIPALFGILASVIGWSVLAFFFVANQVHHIFDAIHHLITK